MSKMRQEQTQSSVSLTLLHNGAGALQRANGVSGEPHPLASVAGMFADDPTWEEFILAMEEARREEDAL
ncbi:MAG: hypothetical protein M3Y28_10560, partial [Armatimonadota bacterium]|nr:hypothetical protein [Armatimonadota bacterium]